VVNLEFTGDCFTRFFQHCGNFYLRARRERCNIAIHLRFGSSTLASIRHPHGHTNGSSVAYFRMFSLQRGHCIVQGMFTVGASIRSPKKIFADHNHAKS
jgi:hypothetical protein